MMYTYRIDGNDTIIEDENFISEPWVCLDKTEVDFLVKMLKTKRRNTILEQLDYLRDALRSSAGIGVLTYYSLVRAIVDRYFKTDFKIKEPKYYIHILPSLCYYLNMRHDGTFLIADSTEAMGVKTKFTMAEIGKMKRDSRFKGINFEECLEEVENDD